MPRFDALDADAQTQPPDREFAQSVECVRAGKARAFLKQDIGTIEVGMVADLLVVEENPLADVRNLANLEHVFKAGRRYAPLGRE